MGNLRITMFALLLVVWPTNTNPHQARIKDSDSAIVVVSRRVNGQVVRSIAAGQQHKQDALTELSDLCREPGRNHNVVSCIDDSNNVTDLFDALKWIEQAKCDGSIGTIVSHEGKGYEVKLREIAWYGLE